MSTSGRSYFWGKDAGWWRRRRNVVLLREFGVAGPAVIDWLSCEAKAQHLPGSKAGYVKTGVESIADALRLDDEEVRAILSRSVTLLALDDYEEHDDLFTCRVSGWADDQKRMQDAMRQQAKRDRDKTETPDEHGESDVADDVASHAASRSVTERHANPPRGEERREETEEEEARESDGLIHPQLHDVLAILHGAPGLLVEELAVNAALMSRPDLDAIEVARRVESWAHEGGLHNRAANRLLMAAADKIDQREAAKTGIRTAVERREDRKGGRKDQRDERADEGLAALERLMTATPGGPDAVA